MTWSALILGGVVGLILGITLNLRLVSKEDAED